MLNQSKVQYTSTWRNQGYIKVVKSRVPKDSKSLGGARGVLASFPFPAAAGGKKHY